MVLSGELGEVEVQSDWEVVEEGEFDLLSDVHEDLQSDLVPVEVVVVVYVQLSLLTLLPLVRTTLDVDDRLGFVFEDQEQGWLVG